MLRLYCDAALYKAKLKSLGDGREEEHVISMFYRLAAEGLVINMAECMGILLL